MRSRCGGPGWRPRLRTRARPACAPWPSPPRRLAWTIWPQFSDRIWPRRWVGPTRRCRPPARRPSPPRPPPPRRRFFSWPPSAAWRSCHRASRSSPCWPCWSTRCPVTPRPTTRWRWGRGCFRPPPPPTSRTAASISCAPPTAPNTIRSGARRWPSVWPWRWRTGAIPSVRWPCWTPRWTPSPAAWARRCASAGLGCCATSGAPRIWRRSCKATSPPSTMTNGATPAPSARRCWTPPAIKRARWRSAWRR